MLWFRGSFLVSVIVLCVVVLGRYRTVMLVVVTVLCWVLGLPCCVGLTRTRLMLLCWVSWLWTRRLAAFVLLLTKIARVTTVFSPCLV